MTDGKLKLFLNFSLRDLIRRNWAFGVFQNRSSAVAGSEPEKGTQVQQLRLLSVQTFMALIPFVLPTSCTGQEQCSARSRLMCFAVFPLVGGTGTRTDGIVEIREVRAGQKGSGQERRKVGNGWEKER